jgi:hypothetical protein
LLLKLLEKQEKVKSITSRRAIKKIRAEINELSKRKEKKTCKELTKEKLVLSKDK